MSECLGRSRGGMGTKIHACTDALGNAVRLIATGGQAGDCPQALPLLAVLTPGNVLAETKTAPTVPKMASRPSSRRTPAGSSLSNWTRKPTATATKSNAFLAV